MTGSLRILLLADMPPRADSGASGTEMALADALEGIGHDVTRVWADAFRHRIRHWNLYHLLEQPGEMRRVIAGQLAVHGPFDVLHVNQPAGWLAARAHRRAGTPGLFVHRSHGFEPRMGAVVRRWLRVYPEDGRPRSRQLLTGVLSGLLERNYRGILRWADAHVVSCGECADDLVARGARRERVHVSPQAPTRKFCDRTPGAWTADRARHLLYVGQHAFIKAPMLVAEVFGRWLAVEPGRRATWVCEEPAHPAVRERLDPAIRDRVRLLSWRSRAELIRVYDEAGFFLFPSFAEGFGKVFLEAMARGLCVVATAQGGARDVITPGADGELVPVGDGAGLAARLEALAHDVGRAEAMARRARETAERYTWYGIASELAAFYSARLASTRGAAA